MRKKMSLSEILRGKENFGYLKVICEGQTLVWEASHPKRTARCKCICGIEKDVQLTALMSGKTKSCGCGGRVRFKTHGPEYKSWATMKQRCLNKNDKNYFRYGGRGIKIYQPWIDNFDNFCADMGERPEGKTLDRKDVNGDYEPGNCKWSFPKDQARNKTNTFWVEFQGKKMALSAFSEITMIDYKTAAHLIREENLTADEIALKAFEGLAKIFNS